MDDVFRSDKQNGHLGAGVRGIEKKEEKIKREVGKMKLILSTIHLTQVAFLEEKSLVRMTSLIMYSR